MYIPSLSFGGLNTCVSASGGTTGEFLSGSILYKYHKFSSTGSHTFTIHSGSASQAKVFMVGGGGGGGFTEANAGASSNQSAGGGGGGGVVFTDYRLGPGTYNLFVGDGGDPKGGQGEDSWIEMEYIPSNYNAYTTSVDRLTAEGGGYGGYFLNLNNTTTGKVNATSGGSGGGGCASLRFISGYTIANSGNGRSPQGFNAGIPNGDLCQSTSETTAVGGGGSGGASANTDCVFPAGYLQPGGNGAFFNVDGTSKRYSVGGPGMRIGVWELASGDTSESREGRPIGAGGFGGSDDFSKSLPLAKGREGVVVIMYPLCKAELSECTTYSVFGGINGGNITFLPCGTSELETIALDPLDLITLCAYSSSQYPSGSGTVTATITGSCDEYVEPANPESCPTGSTLSPLFLTEVVVDAPPVGPYPGYITFTYTDYLGNTQSGQFSTGTYTLCAQSGSFLVTTRTFAANEFVSDTDIQCGYYCSGSI